MRNTQRRFQRGALVAEAARLESYIDDQIGVTIKQHGLAEDTGPTGLAEKLSLRWQQLNECRRLANELRTQIWQLD